MKLSTLIQKENNNIDAIRLVAACAVIYGHGYAISPQAGHYDFVLRLLGHDYSGSLAVKLFFFLSGLVVTNSLLQKRSITQFTIARFFRIVPALIAVVVVSAIALGPMVTNLSLRTYYSNPQVYTYIFDNILFKTDYFLPGVFSGNPYPSAVNGSLWTLPYEVSAYIGLLALFLAGAFRLKLAVILVFLLIFGDALSGHKILLQWWPKNSDIDFLLPCFALGALFAYFKDQLVIDTKAVLGIAIVYWLFRRHEYGFIVFYLWLFVSTLWIASQPWFLKFRPRSDLSYGVYVWGFPVQQSVQYFVPEGGLRFNQLAALCIAMGLAWLSWHLVEKGGIELGRRLVHRLAASS